MLSSKMIHRYHQGGSNFNFPTREKIIHLPQVVNVCGSQFITITRHFHKFFYLRLYLSSMGVGWILDQTDFSVLSTDAFWVKLSLQHGCLLSFIRQLSFRMNENRRTRLGNKKKLPKTCLFQVRLFRRTGSSFVVGCRRLFQSRTASSCSSFELLLPALWHSTNEGLKQLDAKIQTRITAPEGGAE